jgi:hypothetical protein
MGKTRESGHLTSDDLLTTDIVNNTVKVGTGITFYGGSVGIISATKFYGDGSNLKNIQSVLQDWVIKTSNYTAAIGDQIIADTSGGEFIITLPTSPSVGNVIRIADPGSWAINNLKLSPNGLTIEGDSDNFIVDIGGTILEVIYDGSTWEVYSSLGGPGATGDISLRGNLSVSGFTTSNQTRFLSVAEKLFRVNGNTVSIAYTSTGANIGLCTNPSGDITLNVTGIPIDSSFDNHVITFSVISTQAGTARSCTAVNLNGVSRTIFWSGGSLSSAISGVTTTRGYDIYNFTGINTVGSASTTANYIVLGVVNGGFR